MPDVAGAEQTAALTEPSTSMTEMAKRGAELRVSARLMALDTGLFCIFQTPGSPTPDATTGLPEVRITPAPGISGRPEAVSVSTFREDGWLNGTAALVRVMSSGAQVLVSIYQQKEMDATPQLKLLRLSGDPRAAAPRVPSATVANLATPQVSNPEVIAHIQRRGDVGCMLGEWIGVKGSRQWVEGFGISPSDFIAPGDIEYQAVLGRDWLSPWVEGGKYCGSRGMALPLLGLKIRLKGAAAKAYTCCYSATFVDGSIVGSVGNGEICEAESLAALESFQVMVIPIAHKAVQAKRTPGRSTLKPPSARFASRPSGRT